MVTCSSRKAVQAVASLREHKRPFNIASYALLTHIFANMTDLEVGTLTHHLGDLHIYKNHFEQVEELKYRATLRYPQPQLELLSDKLFYDDLKLEQFKVTNYEPGKRISAPVAV